LAKSLLDDREMIPAFTLAGKDDAVFDSLEFKRKKNLVLFFLTHPHPEFFLKLEESYRHLREQNAEVAVICVSPVGEIENHHRRNRLSFWILADPDSKVFSKFIRANAGEEAAALFITDKFGELFFQYLAPGARELPPMEDIVKSLVFIESQCSE
jgi:peroxiredoxin